MALDRAIQLSVEADASAPTLRLYRWKNPTVTLGRFQDKAGVDLTAAREMGVDVVRRFTGGRGVLHDNELTYAVIAGTKDGVPRGVAASYRYLCQPLARAYQLLGVDAELTERDRAASPSAACYLATTRADLSLGALKLSGSAQVWSGSTVLQHGSFTISRDVAREARIFSLTPDEAEKLKDSAATFESINAPLPTVEQIAEKVIEAFSAELDIEFLVGRATDEELALADSLMSQVQP